MALTAYVLWALRGGRPPRVGDSARRAVCNYVMLAIALPFLAVYATIEPGWALIRRM